MYYNFFIHSSVNGHLGCFHVLATVNSAEMTQETQTGALYQPREVGWGGRWEGVSKGKEYICIPMAHSEKLHSVGQKRVGHD